MRISNIEVMVVNLPFRVSFGHNLASRKSSSNVLVKTTLESDDKRVFTGYGESIPRDYVTGETIQSALKAIESQFIPQLKDFQFETPLAALAHLETYSGANNAAWCAVEISILDALAKASNLQLAYLLSLYDSAKAKSPAKASSIKSTSIESVIDYGGVVPFGPNPAIAALILCYRLYGFKTVKLKMGRDFERGLFTLKMARKLMGSEATIRTDANCAWTVEETLFFAEKMRKYKVSSIEQPIDAENIAGLQRLTAEVPETIVADESLCTLDQAKLLISTRACDAFNIRLSKVGGVLASMQMADMARQAGLGCLMGAQVGESAILSAAARAFAAVKGPFDNCEGSFNKLLLHEDLSNTNIGIAPGGIGQLPTIPGIGVEVDERKLKKYASSQYKTTATGSQAQLADTAIS
ncbi:hypothetical protein KA183_10795 [bacterium]|nr:hypothetical protein [bacterium]QQR57508.1 MAG: hypothetical protein IPG59_21420 [Candidatus Melainabacteria bacterium]